MVRPLKCSVLGSGPMRSPPNPGDHDGRNMRTSGRTNVMGAIRTLKENDDVGIPA